MLGYIILRQKVVYRRVMKPSAYLEDAVFLSSFELCDLEISHLATSSQKDFARDAALQASCAKGDLPYI
jgi:hypothetical protein